MVPIAGNRGLGCGFEAGSLPQKILDLSSALLNNTLMHWPIKIAVALLTCVVPAMPPTRTQKIFTIPGGVFRLRYPDFLVKCIPRAEGSSSPDSCQSQGAECSAPGSDGATLACFAFPRDKFRDGQQFVAATVFVAEISSAKTQKTCLSGSHDWFVIGSKTKTTMIHGVRFRQFEVGDNWAGGGQSGPVYRTFHRGICYELGIQEVISRAAYDPERNKPLTPADFADMRKPLAQVIESFTFLK